MKSHKEAFVNLSKNLTAPSLKFANIYFVTGIILLIAVFLFIDPAMAQSDTTDTGDSVSDPLLVVDGVLPIEEVVVVSEVDVVLESVANQSAIEDVLQDETVSYQDLEAKVPAILPDSALYSFKRFGRGLRKAFTFNSVKKIELEIHYANQELADAQQLLNEKQNKAGVEDKVIKSVKKFEETLQNVRENAKSLRPEDAKRVVENILDKQIKQQKVLSGIENKILDSSLSGEAKDKVLSKIEEAKTRSADHVANTVGKLEEDQTLLAQHFDAVFENQRGSEFRDLRNLEVLNRLEDFVPEEAREAIESAQRNAIKRFYNNVNEIPEELRAARFEKYVGHSSGEESRNLEIFESIKNSPNATSVIINNIEQVKEISSQKFKDRLESYGNDYGDGDLAQRFRDRAFNQFKTEQGVDIGKLRAFDEIKNRVNFEGKLGEEISKQREESVDAFINEINKVKGENSVAAGELTGAANEFRRLSREIVENPNPAAFRLLQELEKKVKSDPEAAAILSKIESETKQRFVDRSEQEGEEFYKRIISGKPGDVEIFRKLQEDFNTQPQNFGTSPVLGGEGQVWGQDGIGLPNQINENKHFGFDDFLKRAVRVSENEDASDFNSINYQALSEKMKKEMESGRFFEGRNEFYKGEDGQIRTFEQNGQSDFNSQNRQPNILLPKDDNRLKQELLQNQRPSSEQPSQFLGRPEVGRPDLLLNSGNRETNRQRQNATDDYGQNFIPNQPPQVRPLEQGEPSNYPETERFREDTRGLFIGQSEQNNQGEIRQFPDQIRQDDFRSFNDQGQNFNDGQVFFNTGSPASPPDFQKTPEGNFVDSQPRIEIQSVSSWRGRVVENPVSSQSKVLRMISFIFGQQNTYAR